VSILDSFINDVFPNVFSYVSHAIDHFLSSQVPLK